MGQGTCCGREGEGTALAARTRSALNAACPHYKLGSTSFQSILTPKKGGPQAERGNSLGRALPFFHMSFSQDRKKKKSPF